MKKFEPSDLKKTLPELVELLASIRIHGTAGSNADIAIREAIRAEIDIRLSQGIAEHTAALVQETKALREAQEQMKIVLSESSAQSTKVGMFTIVGIIVGAIIGSLLPAILNGSVCTSSVAVENSTHPFSPSARPTP